MKAHEFLASKGVKSLNDTYTAYQILKWMIEFESQQQASDMAKGHHPTNDANSDYLQGQINDLQSDLEKLEDRVTNLYDRISNIFKAEISVIVGFMIFLLILLLT